MEFEILEKIVNLCLCYQSERKALQINIDPDLLKILPLPRKLVLDLLSNALISTFFRLSNDKKTLHYENNFRLCSIDQNQGGSCYSPLCKELHLCLHYLLNETCSQFLVSGECSRSHSLSTNHNENVLRKYNLSSKDDQTFSLVSRLIRLTLSNSSIITIQTINGQQISDQLIYQWLDEHQSLVKTLKLINPNTIQLTFDDDEVASMMEDYINQHYSRTVVINKNLSADLIENERPSTNGYEIHSFESEPLPSRPFFERGRGRAQTDQLPPLNNSFSGRSFSPRRPSNLANNGKKFTFSHRLNSIQTSTKPTKNSTNNETTEYDERFSNDRNSSYFSKSEKKRMKSLSIEESNEIASTHYDHSMTRLLLDHSSTKSKENNSNEVLINYKYEKGLLDEQLYYLLGPGREEIIERDQCQIIPCLSSGYCRVRNIEQGREIEKALYSILPHSFHIDTLNIDDDLALIISSAAAENIFEQNQTDYVIVTEPTKVQLNIEIVHGPTLEYGHSLVRHSSSDGKFHIDSTGSSINVICGDISEIPVDLMICVSTSNNLCENILRRAGPNIESQYKEHSCPNDVLLLNGGLTAARKILFVPWQTEIEQGETTKSEKSLSDLVKWCIEQAKQRDLKSISFPPIGSGQLGLDSFLVCDTMISAANEQLHQYQLDVSFVIYSSTNMNEEDECYQIFRIYLDNLCEQMKSKTNTNSERTMNKTEVKRESIRRNIQSKQILILSDSSKSIKNPRSLIRSLEELIVEKTFPLSLIEYSLIDEMNFLIDVCLKSNVYPHLNYTRDELTLRGDRDSCLQCFFNLRQGKSVSQYSFESPESEEKILNCYISLKIDQALAVGERIVRQISIEEDQERISHIDLNKFQIRFNREKSIYSLQRKQFNDQIYPPSSWSSSILMIRTVLLNKSSFETLECFQLFQQTMSMFQWQIERIEAIENYPLYLHFMSNKKNNQTKLYFHACSYASVQSIIHYGLHSTNASYYGYQYENSIICLTRDVLDSHLYGSRPSTDGKYYLFAVQVATNKTNNQSISLSNDESCFALPTYLIVYRKEKHFL